MKVINAIYNFIVGDMIILVGIIIAIIILSLIGFVSEILCPQTSHWSNSDCCRTGSPHHNPYS